MHQLLKPKGRVYRLRRRIEELATWRVAESRPVGEWTFEGEPIGLLQAWPRRDGVVRLAGGAFVVPEAWTLEDTRLELDVGGESLLHVHYASGSRVSFGLDAEHSSFILAERSGALETESVARAAFAMPVAEPRLMRAKLVRLDMPVVRLTQLLSRIAVAAGQLEEQDAGAALLDAADEALDRVRMPTATEVVLSRESGTVRGWGSRDAEPPRRYPRSPLDEASRQSVTAAVAFLTGRLKALKAQYPQQGRIGVVGHAHIDTAWLWTIDETHRKLRRTFSTVADLLDRNPGFRFAQSFAEYYRTLETLDPGLLARIRAHVEAGRWEPVGGFWVEPDINMPSGESLARQALYGQRYFAQAFGRTHDVAWLPDTFGFSPALPQILRLAGLTAMFTIKLGWSETNAFPHTRFWWEGIDGSQVLVHHNTNMFDGYNGHVEPDWTMRLWRNHTDRRIAPEALLPVGYGDGGGGPTQDMIDAFGQLADFPALPRLEYTTVGEFFDRARAQAERSPLPEWVGELYLEYHRGVLTTQGRTKRLHRQAERDLVAAEAFATAGHMLAGGGLPSLEPAWRTLMVNQFHDILPGSSIGDVYRRTERELAELSAEADTLGAGAMAQIGETFAPDAEGGTLLVANPDLSPRPLRLTSASPLPGGQAVGDGWILASDEVVAPFSFSVLRPGDLAQPASAGPLRLENRFVAVNFGPDGTLSSVIDRRSGREVLAGRGNQIQAWSDQPRWFDAWDIEADYRRAGEEALADGEIEILEAGGQRAALRIRRRIGASTMIQDVRLWANSPRIDFHTQLDWRDRNIFLRAHFPVAVRSDTATYECAFGVQRRPTHANTSWDAARFEVPAHRFVDLSEPGYGVALLNNGRYGHEVRGGEMSISLLRSPMLPDREADEGAHSLTYSLLPHAGDWHEGGVLAEAEDLNRPLFATVVAPARAGTVAPLQVEGLAVALSALKPAEDGDGVILRLYEPSGARGAIRITPAAGWEVAGAVDLLERPLDVSSTAFSPFEVKSLRLRHK